MFCNRHVPEGALQLGTSARTFSHDERERLAGSSSRSRTCAAKESVSAKQARSCRRKSLQRCEPLSPQMGAGDWILVAQKRQMAQSMMNNLVDVDFGR